MSSLTPNIVLSRLQQRMTITNAKLLLDSAKISSGVTVANETVMDKEQAKTLVLRMINQGGPAFQVGQSLYKEYLM